MIVGGFAGPGGWDVALSKRGAKHIGMELDQWACATRAAERHPTIRCDVTQYPTAPFTGSITGKVDSPVCTPYSRAGKGKGVQDLPLVHQAVEDLAAGRDTRARIGAACADPLSILAAEPMRWHHDLRPEWIAMEQVPDVLPLWRQYARILRGWGYSVWTGILNTADHGVPQTRRRAILIASRLRNVKAPARTHTEYPADDLFGERLLPWVSMADALDWPSGVRINTRGERRTSGGNNFRADAPSWTLTEKARSWWVLRHSARSNATTRRLDQPAATIVAGHARRDYVWETVGDGPQERRPLALSEAAVLQGFRAKYKFQGSESQAFKQIANAMPPRFAEAVLDEAAGPATEYEVAA